MSTLKFKVTSSDAYKSVDDYTKLAIDMVVRDLEAHRCIQDSTKRRILADIDLNPKLIRLFILNFVM